jgi:TonB family protein
MFLVILFFGVCFGQSNSAQRDPAYPALGWDSLKTAIQYPEIARRAGVEGISNVAVKIDSVGNVVDIMISGNAIFNNAIEDAVRNVTWQPGIENYKVRTSSVFFEVQFRYRDSKLKNKRVIVIEAEKPQ